MIVRDLAAGSRLADLIGQVERGEEVDYNRLLALQGLDAARDEELAIAAGLRREDEADEWIEQFFHRTDP